MLRAFPADTATNSSRGGVGGGGGEVSLFLSAVQFVGGNHFNASDSRQSVLPVVFSLGLSVILCMDLRRCACLSGILTFAHMPQMAGSSQETQCLALVLLLRLACVSLPPRQTSAVAETDA